MKLRSRRAFVQESFAVATTAAFLQPGAILFSQEPPAGSGTNPVRLGGPSFAKTEDPEELALAHRKLGYRAAYCPNVSLNDADRIRALTDAFAKQDVVIAKNYLSEPELAALNNLVEQYLVFAEGQALRRIPMHMGDWIAKLDGFLRLNERGILTHAGKISHELAVNHAELEYDSFHRQTLVSDATQPDDFEKCLKQLPAPKPHRKKKGGAK